MDLCGLLFAGAIIGALARLLVPGYQPMGILVTVLVGVLGTAGGHVLAQKADIEGVGRWLLALGIAALLVLIVAGAQRWSRRGGGARNH